MKPIRAGLPAVLVLVALAAVGCASSAGLGSSGGDGSTTTHDVDPGFAAISTATDPPSDTSVPGVIMTPPSYVNGSEVADPTDPPLPCAGQSGTGFKISIAADTVGYDTPQQAINAFVATDREYDTGSTSWRIVSDGIDMTATSGIVTLDIASLPNAKWIVDGGARC